MTDSEISTDPPVAVTGSSLNFDLLDQAETALGRDLPALLESWREYWVAYHGNQQLGISYYPERLRRRYALPPEGRLSMWERVCGATHPRHPECELSLYFIDETALCHDFEIASEPWFDEAVAPAVPSSNGQSAPS